MKLDIKPSQMVIYMRAVIAIIILMVKGNIYGRMEHYMQEILSQEKDKEKVNGFHKDKTGNNLRKRV